HRPFLAAIVVISALALGACRPPDPQTAASGEITNGGERQELAVRTEFETIAVGRAPATIHVLDGAVGLAGAAVELRGDMSHAGMQPVIVEAVESEPGVYRAEDFAFTMAGDWFVTTTVTTTDGRVAEEETFVTVSGR